MPRDKRPSKRYQNCFICFFRPALYFGCTGVTVLNFHCDHSERPVKGFFKRSWLATSVSTSIAVTAFLAGVHNAYTLYGTKINTREDVLLLGAVMINFIAAYLLSIGCRRTHLKMRDLEGIVELTKVGERMGIIFFDESFVKIGQTLTCSLITMFLSLEVFTVVVFIIVGDFSLMAYKRLCTDTCVFLQGTLGTHYITLHLAKLHMIQKVLDRMKEIAEDRLNIGDGDNCSHSSEQSFTADIRRLCRLYSCLFLNFHEDDNFVGPAFLVWWNTILGVNIISAYVLLNSVMIQEPLGVVSIFFMLKVYGCILGVIIYLAEMEVTAAVVSQFNSIRQFHQELL